LPPPACGRFLTFGLTPAADPKQWLARVREVRCDEGLVIGLGEPLVRAAGGSVPGLRPFPAVSAPGAAFPSTQGALWAFLGGPDAGAILQRGRALAAQLGDSFRIDEDVPSFQYAVNRDLSGYEDGTENPVGDRAVETAILAGAGAGLDGSSFVAVQRWIHDLAALERMPQQKRDGLIGRKQDTNEEMEDAPPSAHVKRSAQESFDPPAFMVRRSMPFGNIGEHGLYFVAYGASLDRFERVLRRMAGLDDGVVDGLLRFSRAVTGGYYWCPPQEHGRPDLRALSA
jgi:putative iron-dependent peroxidase